MGDYYIASYATQMAGNAIASGLAKGLSKENGLLWTRVRQISSLKPCQPEISFFCRMASSFWISSSATRFSSSMREAAVKASTPW